MIRVSAVSRVCILAARPRVRHMVIIRLLRSRAKGVKTHAADTPDTQKWPDRDTSAPSEHPLIEAGRAKWPEEVEADPDWWVSLARRVENRRFGLNLQRVKRLIGEAGSLKAFKAAVSGKEVASVSA